jgi:Yip1 domain
MNLSERVKGILLKPKQEWQTISGEATTIPELYKTYVVVLAAIGPVATIIGMSIMGIRLPITTSIASGIVHYILTLVGVYVLALIIDGLAPRFSGEKNINQAFKVAAYSHTPGWGGRDSLDHPVSEFPRDPRVIRPVPSLPWSSGSDEIAPGKVLGIHGRGDHCSDCHLCGDRLYLPRLYFLSYASLT